MSNYLWDLVAGTGLLLFTAGLWWISPPVALVVVGLAMCLFGFWGARLFARGRRTPDD
jgi:hypothetical protein